MAYIPFVISSFIKKVTLKPLPFIFLFIAWLLFLPNASYIITDLFHLIQFSSVPKWFDLLMIMSFAINGILLFFLSIYDVHQLLLARLSNSTTWFITVMILFLSGFGIYLGRFLRWNSWDIISNPLLLANDIIHRIKHPLSHPRTWGVTFGFGLLFLFGFLLLNTLQPNQNEPSILKSKKISKKTFQILKKRQKL